MGTKVSLDHKRTRQSSISAGAALEIQPSFVCAITNVAAQVEIQPFFKNGGKKQG